jgi:uncharacterized protein with HEPN domain
MSFEPREFLRHMLAETEYLVRATAGITRAQYDEDETLQRAVMRSLAVLGGAWRCLSGASIARHPHSLIAGDSPWTSIEAVRMRPR